MSSQSQPLVWLITGTSSGFGYDLALAALARNERVIATARASSITRLQPLQALGAATLELDVTSPLETLHEVAKKAIAIYGKVDVLVNNAGYLEVGALEEATPEQTYAQHNTNVFGGLNVARAFLPYMRPRRTGTVVWIGSIAGWRGSVGAGLYVSSKHALRGIAETMHMELEPLGLRSFIFEPGYFRTSFLAGDNISAPSAASVAKTEITGGIADYAEGTKRTQDALLAYNGKQPGDPKRAVEIIIDVVRGEGVVKEKKSKPPVVIQLGSDAYQIVHAKLDDTLKTLEEWKDVICSTDFPKGQ